MHESQVLPEAQRLIEDLVLANLEALKRQADKREFIGISPRVLAEDARLLGVDDVAEMLSRWLQRSSNLSYFYDLIQKDGEGIVEYQRVQVVPGRQALQMQRRSYDESLREFYAYHIHARPHLELATNGDYEKAFESAEEEDEADLRMEEVAALHALKDPEAALALIRERDERYRREAPMRVLAIECGRRGDVNRSRELLRSLNAQMGEDWHRSRAVALGLGGWEPWEAYPLVYW